MTLHKGLYDRLIYEDEVGEVASLTGQNRALVTTPTAHQRREQFIAELVQRLPELLDAAAGNQPDSSEKAIQGLRYQPRAFPLANTKSSRA